MIFTALILITLPKENRDLSRAAKEKNPKGPNGMKVS